MKPFELSYLLLEPCLPPLPKMVRRRLVWIARSYPYRPQILDVGGRKSHYTIGVPASITITDLPRETEIQERLNLGINEKIVCQTRERRSNVQQTVLDDMTRSLLPDATFDCVVAVEVLEHVEEDQRFVHEVHRVLRPGGVFLMTTPNGDYIRNANPDHKRHYTREQLRSCLATQFENVQVVYAVRTGAFRRLGLSSWSARHPWRTAMSLMGNLANSVQSAQKRLEHQAHRTAHLIGMGWKRR